MLLTVGMPYVAVVCSGVLGPADLDINVQPAGIPASMAAGH
jgi:hypothetical protein